jgi:hypothetical protein
MKIENYVKKNYAKLPKSTFIDHGSEKELVIVEEINNWEEGWGHHSYQGVGVDAEGKIFECHSGGCSCSVDVSFSETQKDLTGLKWQDVEFEKIRVDFSSYD